MHRPVWESRPWTAPNRRTAVKPAVVKRGSTPMPLQTKVIPLFHKKAGDRDSGRITADTLLAYLAAQHLVVDEWKIRKMVAEADFDECGLTPAVVRSCLEGAHRHHEYGAADWMELVAMVIGCPVRQLQQCISAAPKGTRLSIGDPGKSFAAEQELDVVYSKSSPKSPTYKAPVVTPPQDAETPSPWRSLLRNSLALPQATGSNAARVVAPHGTTLLDQSLPETAINGTMRTGAAGVPLASFQAQRQFDAHHKTLLMAHAATANGRQAGVLPGNTRDTRKTQSARQYRPDASPPGAQPRAAGLRTAPPRRHYVSMAAVPPIAYVSKAWVGDALPTHPGDWPGAGKEPYRKGQTCHQYRSVRAVNGSNASVLRPSTGVSLSASARRAQQAAAERMRHRPSTAVARHSASVHPGTTVDTLLRTENLTSTRAAGNGIMRVSAPASPVEYPQPSSALKQLRHDQADPGTRLFATYSRPLKPGPSYQYDYQLNLGGDKATLRNEYWNS
eukprot:jgi/Tetstr1/457588/TSEL_044156.t1